MTAPLDIEAIRQRADAVIRRPWTHQAEFIATARADVPALCDEVERLVEKLRKLERDAEVAGKNVIAALEGKSCPWLDDSNSDVATTIKRVLAKIDAVVDDANKTRNALMAADRENARLKAALEVERDDHPVLVARVLRSAGEVNP